MKPNSATRELLEHAYKDFHSRYFRERDPISIVHKYSQPEDREIAAFFAALLSYGNVRTILTSVKTALAYLGNSPKKRLLDPSFDFHFGSFKHRFTTSDDLTVLSYWLSMGLKEHGTLQRFFLAGTHSAGSDMKTILSDFVRRLTHTRLPARLQKIRGQRERNLKYLLSDPMRGSACKRLNMFLRWMVRSDDGIDLGLWTSLSPEQLMLPIDTHLLKTLRALRWTRSTSATWKVVEDATLRLRSICPEDPIRYDFALCHLSMNGHNIKSYGSSKGIHAQVG